MLVDNGAITHVIKRLRACVVDLDKYYGDSADLLNAMQLLCINEAHVAGVLDALPLLEEVMWQAEPAAPRDDACPVATEAYHEDLVDHYYTKMHAAHCLTRLCFSATGAGEVKRNAMVMKSLRKYATAAISESLPDENSPRARLKRYCCAALFQLGEAVDEEERASQENTKQKEEGTQEEPATGKSEEVDAPHIMISYSWAYQVCAYSLNAASSRPLTCVAGAHSRR